MLRCWENLDSIFIPFTVRSGGNLDRWILFARPWSEDAKSLSAPMAPTWTPQVLPTPLHSPGRSRQAKAKAEHEARTRPPSFVISHSTGPYRPWRTAKPKSRNPNQTQRRQRPSAVVARSRPVAPGPPEGRRPSRAAGGSAPTRIRASRRTLRGLLSGLVAGNRGARPPPPPPPPW